MRGKHSPGKGKFQCQSFGNINIDDYTNMIYASLAIWYTPEVMTSFVCGEIKLLAWYYHISSETNDRVQLKGQFQAIFK